MNASYPLKIAGFASIALLLAACANTAPPTHRWASSEDANKARYTADHNTCKKNALIEVDQSQLDPQSPAFQAYKQCMNNQGYVLTAYNDE